MRSQTQRRSATQALLAQALREAFGEHDLPEPVLAANADEHDRLYHEVLIARRKPVDIAAIRSGEWPFSEQEPRQLREYRHLLTTAPDEPEEGYQPDYALEHDEAAASLAEAAGIKALHEDDMPDYLGALDAAARLLATVPPQVVEL